MLTVDKCLVIKKNCELIQISENVNKFENNKFFTFSNESLIKMRFTKVSFFICAA